MKVNALLTLFYCKKKDVALVWITKHWLLSFHIHLWEEKCR